MFFMNSYAAQLHVADKDKSLKVMRLCLFSMICDYKMLLKSPTEVSQMLSFNTA